MLLSTEVTANAQFKRVTINGTPVIVYASSTQLAGGVQRGSVWIVAFSRVCTHEGTSIGNPANGIMTCPNHSQQFTASSGTPTGSAGKTSKPLAQYSLQVASDNTVWATGILRP